MSDTFAKQAPAPAAPVGPAVALSVFAAGLKAQRKGDKVFAGDPDEVWLKLLQINHGRERRSLADWSLLIDQYRDGAAHPADPRFGV